MDGPLLTAGPLCPLSNVTTPFAWKSCQDIFATHSQNACAIFLKSFRDARRGKGIGLLSYSPHVKCHQKVFKSAKIIPDAFGHLSKDAVR